MAPTDDTQADGYYGDEDVSNEEIDLSFLDDDEPEADTTTTPKK